MKRRILIIMLTLGVFQLGCEDAASTDSTAEENTGLAEAEENRTNPDGPVDRIGSESTTGDKPEGNSPTEEGDEGETCTGEDCDDENGCVSEDDCSFISGDNPECSVIACGEETGACEVIDDPVPGCLAPKAPDNALCVLQGEAGEEFTCGIRVARTNSAVPGPVSLSITLEYPGSLLQPSSVVHYPCGISGECDPIDVLNTPLDNGSVVTLKPGILSNAEGLIQIDSIGPEDEPDTLLTEATTDDENDLFLEVTFTLPVTLKVPIWVELNNPNAGAFPGAEVTAEYVDEVLIIDGTPVVAECDPETDPACAQPPKDYNCPLSGKAGEEVRCDIELVRASDEDGRPVAGNFTAVYDETRLKLVRFESQDCVLSDCTPVAIPEEPLATGHGVVMDPPDAEEWTGLGTLTFVSPVDSPDPIALTEVALDATGVADGNPAFVSGVFVLIQDVSDEQPTGVTIGQTAFVGGVGTPLTSTTEGRQIVVSGNQQCPFAPGCGVVEIEEPEIPTPEYALCRIFGQPGDVIDCPFAVARTNEAYYAASNLQFTLLYDSNNITFEGVFANICFDGEENCFEQSVVAGGQNLPTGHTFSTAPLTVEEWDGQVAFILTNLSKPETPITEAYLDELGNMTGEPQFATARFTLNTLVPADSPFFVQFNPEDIVVGYSESVEDGGNAGELPIKIQEGLILTGQPMLEEVP